MRIAPGHLSRARMVMRVSLGPLTCRLKQPLSSGQFSSDLHATLRHNTTYHCPTAVFFIEKIKVLAELSKGSKA